MSEFGFSITGVFDPLQRERPAFRMKAGRSCVLGGDGGELDSPSTAISLPDLLSYSRIVRMIGITLTLLECPASEEGKTGRSPHPGREPKIRVKASMCGKFRQRPVQPTL